MKFDAVIRQVSSNLGIHEDTVKMYLKAYLEAQRRSVSTFQPVRIYGHASFNLHNYILKHKQVGEPLPMPEGVLKTFNQDRSAYNHHRKRGTFLKVGDIIGVVLNQVGEDGITFLPLCKLEPYLFGKHERMRAVFFKGEPIELKKGDYKRTGTIKAYFGMAGHKIDPPMTTRGFLKRLKQVWIE